MTDPKPVADKHHLRAHGDGTLSFGPYRMLDARAMLEPDQRERLLNKLAQEPKP